MNFKSDNVTPVHPNILQAVMEANMGYQDSYGCDDYSQKLQKRFSEVFDTDVIVYLVNTGTAANSLALSAMVKPYEVIFCSADAHILTDECGAPEFYTNGAKIVPLETYHGKLKGTTLGEKHRLSMDLKPHTQKPGCISITQATECGTVYTVSEIQEINRIAENYHLPLHMDGARFANGLVTLGCSPGDMTWRAGVDVLSFGATKNGAMCAEAIVFFNHAYAKHFDYLHKRAGQLMSKSRFIASQFLAYFEDNLWLENARHANMMAREVAQIFVANHRDVIYPVESNEVFVKVSPDCADHLRQNGFSFYSWGLPGSNVYRFVTSWETVKSDVEALNQCLSGYGGQ